METVMPTDDENSAKMVKFFEQIGRGKGGFVVQIVFFLLKWLNSSRTSIQNVEPKLVDSKLLRLLHLQSVARLLYSSDLMKIAED